MADYPPSTPEKRQGNKCRDTILESEIFTRTGMNSVKEFSLCFITLLIPLFLKARSSDNVFNSEILPDSWILFFDLFDLTIKCMPLSNFPPDSMEFLVDRANREFQFLSCEFYAKSSNKFEQLLFFVSEKGAATLALKTWIRS